MALEVETALRPTEDQTVGRERAGGAMTVGKSPELIWVDHSSKERGNMSPE